jgi:CheY-like chemotaxis protein
MAAGASRKILFLDGGDLVLDLESTFLARPEFHVVHGSPGQDPLGLIQRERPDLLVLELHASNPASLKVCRAVKGDPVLGETPVLLLSTPTLRRDARAAGADAVVFTPLVHREFLEIVRRLLPIASRRDARCPVHMKVALAEGGDEFEAWSRDLSETGMSLSASRCPAPGAGVRLRFVLPEGAEEISCGAIVRGPRGPGGAAGGFGVEFDGMDPSDRERIARFVRDRLSRPIELP